MIASSLPASAALIKQRALDGKGQEGRQLEVGRHRS